MLAAAVLPGAAWVGAASATPAPPAIVCAGNGVPVAPGGVATQGPVACTGLAVPGLQVEWATGEPGRDGERGGPVAGAHHLRRRG